LFICLSAEEVVVRNLSEIISKAIAEKEEKFSNLIHNSSV